MRILRGTLARAVQKTLLFPDRDFVREANAMKPLVAIVSSGTHP